jgi:hypothetical protein
MTKKAPKVAPRPSVPDFIEVYEGALEPATCERLIERFHASGLATPGVAGGTGRVRPAVKNSLDITISDHPEWREAEAELNAVAFRGVVRYARRYPYVFLGPFAPTVSPKEPGAEPRLAEARDLDDENVRLSLAVSVLRPGNINLQHYLADQGGYPRWHCEWTTRLLDDGDSLHRLLLWSIYLNDRFDEGETEFLYQGRKIKPRTGSLLIAPAGFTHIHRGNRPRRGDKYIATSWILLKRAENIYPGTAPGG